MNKRNRLSIYILSVVYACAILLIGIFAVSCNHHNFNTDAELTFSTDTLLFDTVFTTTTSITRSFTVTNPTSEPVKLDIFLAGSNNSYYSINVDGRAGTEFHDVEIAAHDSIFVFVKVTINPVNQDNPYLITDSVVFQNENNRQSVQLVAFGQDAHFIVPDHLNSSMHYNIVAGEHQHTHWTNDKPWVIYGWAVVDSLGTLTIDPGTRIYVHSGGGIWVYRYGNIQVNGTAEQPVRFSGDRLEPFYASDYAQWDRIWINEGNLDNVINHAIITNASIGLQISALEEYLGNKTIVKNSIIHNNASTGVLARAANVEMSNCQISNNGEYSMLLQIGDFTLNHITVSNYSAHTKESVALCNFYNGYEYNAQGEVVSVTTIGDANLQCNNSIIYGLADNEFATHTQTGASLSYHFQNCIVKKEEFDNYFVNCLKNKDPLFISNYEQDCNLQATSPAIDAGKTGLGITTDLLGRSRNGVPDIGAYEYYPQEDGKRL